MEIEKYHNKMRLGFCKLGCIIFYQNSKPNLPSHSMVIVYSTGAARVIRFYDDFKKYTDINTLKRLYLLGLLNLIYIKYFIRNGKL